MTRLFNLRNEVIRLIEEKVRRARRGDAKKARAMLAVVSDEEFWLYVAYMSDIYSSLNKFCVAMQGKNVNLLGVSLHYEKTNIIVIVFKQLHEYIYYGYDL